jgi:hypothetical protein
MVNILAGDYTMQRLIYFYKVVEGQIPAIPPHEYISHQKPKRHIRARTFQDCETTNIVNSQVRNNTRAGLYIHEEESLVSAPQPLC